jgi:hypothetical protein
MAAGPISRGNVTPWIAAHRYYAEVQLRGRMTRLDDFLPEVRRYPLCSPELRQLGAAAMWHHPELDLTARTIERLAPGLDEIEVPPSPTADMRSLVQHALTSQRSERHEVLTALAETDSAAWDTIQRTAYRHAADDYESLAGPKRRALHGAAVAISWLRR